MHELTFAHGNGRLLRSTTALVFTESSADELLGLFADDRHVDFKELAAHIVAAGFDLPAFAVVDLVEAKVFVFGDIQLRSEADLLSGSASSTWHEGPLNLNGPIAVGPDGDLSDGQLKHGWVAAKSFRFSSTDAIGDRGAATAAAEPDDNPALDLAPDLSPQPELAPELDVEMPPDAEQVVVTRAMPFAPEETGLEASDIDDEWDPLADPEVDLERIGAQELVEDLTAATFSPSTEQSDVPEQAGDGGLDDFVPDDTVDQLSDPRTPRPSGHLTNLPPPPGATPFGSSTEPVAPLPPPPPIVPIGEPKSAPTIPAPVEFADPSPTGRVRATLRFDDGQSAEIRDGLYVGRHPTKAGLPQNYDSVTIRGEHVSRVHWEFVVEDDHAIVRDLGSNSGTEVEINGRRVRVPDGGMYVSPGAKVCFADRWAIYETE